MKLGIPGILLLLIILLSLNDGHSQNPSQSLLFEQLPYELNWASKGVTDILQDHRGYIWIATWANLTRYDGYSLKTYRREPDKDNGLKGNKFTCLLEDKQGMLWIGTHHNGLYRYDRELDKFQQYSQHSPNSTRLSDDRIWSLHEDTRGNLWIGTEQGLNRMNPSRDTVDFFFQSNLKGSLADDFVYSFAETTDQSIWVGCEKGLNRMVTGEGSSKPYFVSYSLSPPEVSEEDYLRHNFIKTIFPSKREANTLWIGTSIGLKKVKYSTTDLTEVEVETFYHDPGNPKSLGDPFVADLLEDPSGQYLWIATFNGLSQMDLHNNTFQTYQANEEEPRSLSNNLIRALFKDNSGLLWVGTDKGVNTCNLDGEPFKNIVISGLEYGSKNSITNIVIGKDSSELWLGSYGGGVTRFNANTLEYTSYQLQPKRYANLAGFVPGLVCSQDGWLWAVTQGAGVLKVNASEIPARSGKIKNVIQYTKEDKLQDDYIMSILETQAGDIWIGYWDNGLSRYNKQLDVFEHYTGTRENLTNLSEYPIVHLFETTEGKQSFLWAGLRGGGLLKLAFSKEEKAISLIKRYQYQEGKPGGLSDNSINSSYQANPHQVWIATENGLNVLEVQSDQIRYFLEKDGLNGGIIQSLLEDAHGRLWISTQLGLSTLETNSYHFSFKNYDIYDGLLDNGFISNAAVQLPDGQFVFGGDNGLTLFQPDSIKIDTTPPKVVISDFKLFNTTVPIGSQTGSRIILEKNISETESLTLHHNENVISFEFVGLQFKESEKIRYAYQLEGFDDDWVYTSANQRIAHYTNLPYETFTFKVKAANGDGIWSAPVQLQLTILPPFWRTNWAYLLYSCLLAGFLYGIYRISRMRAEFKHSIQLEKVEREKLEEINQMKLRFFTNISHELRTPLTLIISPLEQLIKSRTGNKDQFKAFTRMHRNANKLLYMINQLLDIRKSEAGLMKLNVAQRNIVKFTKEIIRSFEDLAQNQGIQLFFTSDIPKVNVWYDPDQMEKVFFNLLTNAIKYTPENGKVKVSIFKGKGPTTTNTTALTGEALIIKVTDSGRGIASEQIPHIFDRFYRVEEHNKPGKQQGTGIGLALSKNIIEAHHGAIWVESTAGWGSSFFIALPLGEDHFSVEERRSGVPDSEDVTNYQFAINPVILSQEDSPSQPANGKSTPFTILIVEDNTDIRNYLNEQLSSAYAILEAADGEIGLKQAIANSPDLVIADISMPNMDGIALCKALKTDINTSHIPVILLTARTSLIYQISGFETGADDYITKPFNIQLLTARVGNLIASRQKIKEKFSKSFDWNPKNMVIQSIDEKLLDQIKRIIENHIDDSDFSVEQLAGSLYMSRMQLYRKLKGLTGKSPNEIIRTVRLKRAAQLLESKQYSVSDVTYMVGYNDLNSFRQQFKKEFGMSPSMYSSS